MTTEPAEPVRACAASLAAAAGRAAPETFTALGGGRNNQVYRLVHEDGAATVLKVYFRHGDDPRDRLGHEWAFVRHAWDAGLRSVAEPLAMDRESGMAMYAALPGVPCELKDVNGDTVAQAASFVRALNRDRGAIASLPIASEACFSLGEHLATVDRRVLRLASLEPTEPLPVAAHDFVVTDLLPWWREIDGDVRKIARRLGIGLDDRLDDDAIVLSPSDFGFHNALIHDGRIAFVDFEYAGRDDPTKLIGDFFNQVERPVALRYLSLMLGALGASEAETRRARLLLPVYAVKWTTILLNDFLDVGAARRQFAQNDQREGDGEARLAHQLQAARAKRQESEVMFDA
jgi:hypothetical protein